MGFLVETGFSWFYSWRIGPLSTFCNVHMVPQLMWEPARTKQRLIEALYHQVELQPAVPDLPRDGREQAADGSRDSLAVES